MRHGKRINHLSRTASHRKAMLSNMATSLIQNKRIVTTVAKAKALRKYVEPIITKAKSDTTHSRRMVFRYLQDKESVDILFNDVSEKVADRPGGYTRILKTGNRLGDNASMCVIELVDYNESLLKESKPKRSKTRRRGRGKGGAVATATAAATAMAETEEQVPDAEVVEEPTAAEEAAEVVETQGESEDAPTQEESTEVEAVVEEEQKASEEEKPSSESAAEEVAEPAVVEESTEEEEGAAEAAQPDNQKKSENLSGKLFKGLSICLIPFFIFVRIELGLCTRNLLRALTDYSLGTCSTFPTHHSDAMFPMQKSVRVPIL